MNALALVVAAKAVATLENLKFRIFSALGHYLLIFFTANIPNYYKMKLCLTTNYELTLNTKM